MIRHPDPLRITLERRPNLPSVGIGSEVATDGRHDDDDGDDESSDDDDDVTMTTMTTKMTL